MLALNTSSEGKEASFHPFSLLGVTLSHMHPTDQGDADHQGLQPRLPASHSLTLASTHSHTLLHTSHMYPTHTPFFPCHTATIPTQTKETLTIKASSFGSKAELTPPFIDKVGGGWGWGMVCMPVRHTSVGCVGWMDAHTRVALHIGVWLLTTLAFNCCPSAPNRLSPTCNRWPSVV